MLWNLPSFVEAAEEAIHLAGLGSADSLRQAFVSGLGVTPSEYRARFSARGVMS